MNGIADPGRGIVRALVVGGVVFTLLIGGVGGWAATSQLAGAVIASGSVDVESSVKKVQHPSGGIVGDIRVRDGDRVEAGTLLLRLDETLTRANLAIVDNELRQFQIRQARLEAERDGAGEIRIPKSFETLHSDPEIARIVLAEQTLFESRKNENKSLKAMLRERIAQLRDEIEGLTSQGEAKAAQTRIMQSELAGVEDLYNKNLVQLARLTALQREAVQLQGEQGQIRSQVAQAKGKIAETELQLIQVDQNLRTTILQEIREAQARISELSERKVAAEDQLRRIDLRAPQTGIVHQLSVHTVGGVIGAGETVMEIVPSADMLIVEAKVAPQDIDQVHIRQQAVIRFSAFNQRTTPELYGTVEQVSADLATDPQKQQSFYVARITLPDEEKDKLGDLQLVPGMPAEVFIQTGERTALSYLVKPIQDQLARAFKED